MGKYLDLLKLHAPGESSSPEGRPFSIEKKPLDGKTRGDSAASGASATPTTLTTETTKAPPPAAPAGAGLRAAGEATTLTTKTTKALHVHPLVAQRAAEGRLPARSLIEESLGMTLTELEHSGRCMEVAVPGLVTTLWFVPGLREVELLRMDGVRRGRIWTVVELRDMMAAPGITHEDVLALARAKLAFNASLTDVRPADPPGPASFHKPDPQPVQRPLDLGNPHPRENDR